MNEREELERLRKLKRLRELEAKAAGVPVGAEQNQANPDGGFFATPGGEFVAGAGMGVADVLGTVGRATDFVTNTVFPDVKPIEAILGEPPKQYMQGLNERYDQRFGDSWPAFGGRIVGQVGATLPATAGLGAGLAAAGRAAPAVAPAANFLRGAGGLTSRMAGAALQGGTASGLALGGASDDPLRDIGTGAAIGAAIPFAGAAGRKLGRKAGQLLSRPPLPKGVAASAKIANAPTTDQLRKAASAAFSGADDIRFEIKPGVLKSKIDDIAAHVSDEGIDPVLHPKASRALQRMLDLVHGSQDDIVKVRRVAGMAANSTDADERRIALILQNKLDDMIDRLGPDDVISGSPKAAGEMLKRGRSLWGAMRKSEAVDNAIVKAQGTASGVENGLRIEFRKLLNNKKFMRGVTPTEQRAMEAVVHGNFTTNTLKRIGRMLSPGAGQQTNALSSSLMMLAAGGVGHSVAGFPGLLAGGAAMAGGYGAQRGAQALTQRQAELARAMVASRAGSAGAPQVGKLARALIEAGRRQPQGAVSPLLVAPVAIKGAQALQ